MEMTKATKNFSVLLVTMLLMLPAAFAEVQPSTGSSGGGGSGASGIAVAPMKAGTIAFHPGWNMVSVPVALKVSMSDISNSCGTAAYAWHLSESGYVKDSALVPGVGYWVKGTKDCNYPVAAPNYGVEPAALFSGWNLVSSPSTKVSVSDYIGTCTVTGGPWHYNSAISNYERASALVPGEAYWYKVSSSCQLQGEAPPVPPQDTNLTITASEPSIGPSSANVVVTEFADFQCPYCGIVHGKDTGGSQYAAIRGTEPKIIANYAQTGKVRFAYHIMAFLGQESTDAANAALCVREVGGDSGFFAMHDKLFDNQASNENSGGFSKANLKAYAAAIGYSSQQVASCIDSGKYDAQVSQSTADANSRGITGTPSFTVNGLLVGSSEYTAVKAAIDSALGVASPYVSVTSPSSNAQLTAGSPYTVSWSASSDYSNYVTCVTAVYIPTGGEFTVDCGNIVFSAGQTTWNVPSNAPAGQYKIRVGIRGASPAKYWEGSAFNVVAQTTNLACTDSDGGKNYFVKGVGKGVYAGSSSPVIYGTEPNPGFAKPSPYGYSVVYDYCASPNQLNEAFCDANGQLQAEGRACPSGYTCSDGACVSGPTPIACTVPSVPACASGSRPYAYADSNGCMYYKCDSTGTPTGSYWSDWKNRDDPSVTGDWEHLQDYPGICGSSAPIGVQCQTTGGVDYTATGQNVICNPQEGLVCYNNKNSGSCQDYKVRFLCPASEAHVSGSDLAVTSVAVGQTDPYTGYYGLGGGSVPFDVVVKNTGSKASGTYQVRLFIDGMFRTGTNDLPSLAPGAAYTDHSDLQILNGHHTAKAVVYPATSSVVDPAGNNEMQVSFNFASSAANQPPVVNGISGPASVNIGQVVTVYVSASDPEGKPVTYSFAWGDTQTTAVTENGVNYATHTYSAAGTYTVKVTVSDDQGATAQTSTSVVVKSANQPPVITGVSAPSQLKVGETGTWTVSAYDPEGKPVSYAFQWGDITNTGQLPANSASHAYVATGTYTVKVLVVDSEGATTQTTSTVKVVPAIVCPAVSAPSCPSGYRLYTYKDSNRCMAFTCVPTSAPSSAQWSDWKNRDAPSGDGDWETLSAFPEVCTHPIAVECQTASGVDFASAGQNVICNPQEGLVCYNDRNSEGCKDYKVRFLCPAPAWTAWQNRDNPTGEGDWENLAAFTDICQHPLAVECQTVDGADYSTTGQNVTCSTQDGFVCRNSDNSGGCLDYKVRFLCPATQQ